jgi:phospholipid/cholesterol/gamma-HCH transport system ATP-binding protein
MIRFEQVTIQYGHQCILEAENFHLQRGVPHVILGASGGGKTTILKVMLGLIAPVAGRVYLDGVEITSLPERALRPLRKKFAMVFQGGALFDGLTVGENVGYRLLEVGHKTPWIERLVREKLCLVGLEDAIGRYPAELSGGMTKRVAIARALASSPEVILFDEPTAGLDPIAVYNLNRLILALPEIAHITPLVVTHDVPSALTVGQSFSILRSGTFLFQGSRDALSQSLDENVTEFLHPTEASLIDWTQCDSRSAIALPYAETASANGR